MASSVDRKYKTYCMLLRAVLALHTAVFSSLMKAHADWNFLPLHHHYKPLIMLYQQSVFKRRRKASIVRLLQALACTLLLLTIAGFHLSAAGHAEKIPWRTTADITGTVK